MIPVEEALRLTLALAGPVRGEVVPLGEAYGRVLAAPAVSRLSQPPFDSAAMDGYAVREAEMDGPLEMIGEAAAGRGFAGPPAPRSAVRIFTGAPVPGGYDRVVMQENTARDGDSVTITDPSGGRNIRPQGSDFDRGSTVLPPRRLSAADIGLIAAMNVPELAVARRPRVAILPGGDELVPPGTTPGPGQIVSSNDAAIAALVTEAGGVPQVLPIARDTEASLRGALASAEGADLIVTIGGASVGDHDLIAKVTQGAGMELAFHCIAMRPGKPLVAGRLGQAALLGLPGNPVSAITCAILFMQPLIRRMQGLAEVGPTPLPARLARDLPPEGPRQHYLRAALLPGEDLPLIDPAEDQDSARLSLLAESDALLIRPAGDPARRAGERVSYLPLRPRP